MISGNVINMKTCCMGFYFIAIVTEIIDGPNEIYPLKKRLSVLNERLWAIIYLEKGPYE